MDGRALWRDVPGGIEGRYRVCVRDADFRCKVGEAGGGGGAERVSIPIDRVAADPDVIGGWTPGNVDA